MDKGILYLLVIFGVGWLILDEFWGKGLITKFVQTTLSGQKTLGSGGSMEQKQGNEKVTGSGIPRQITPLDPSFGGIGPGAQS